MKRWWEEAARLGELGAYEAYLRAARAALGDRQATRPTAARPAAVSPRARAGSARSQQQQGSAVTLRLNRMDRSPTAKAAVGILGLNAGRVLGAPRGAWNTANDLFDAGVFAARLADPFDHLKSRPGEAATDQLYKGVGNLINRASDVIANPKAAAQQVQRAFDHQGVRLNPQATAMAGTMADEMRRNFNVGLNQGEFAFDAASWLWGAGGAKALVGIGKVAKIAGPEKYIARGVPSGVADYLAKPYHGMGHHTLPLRTKLPTLLGGGPIPRPISDSSFFLLKPDGFDNGDMYELHYQVDPHYYGGKVPAENGGGGWSGRRLGWEKRGPLGTLWFGTTGPMKAAVGGGVVGLGGLVDHVDDEEEH